MHAVDYAFFASLLAAVGSAFVAGYWFGRRYEAKHWWSKMQKPAGDHPIQGRSK